MSALPRKPNAASAEPTPVRPLEIIALIAAIVVCDLTIYRGEGDFGFAALFLLLPILLLFGSPQRHFSRSLGVMSLLLGGVVARLAWCGSWGAVVAGIVCLVGFAMAMAGMTPSMTRVATFASQTIAFGHRALLHYSMKMQRCNRWLPSSGRLVSIGLPLVTCLIFGTLFTLANPDLVKSVGLRIEQLVDSVLGWLENFSLWEIPFCVGAGWIVLGLMRPSPVDSDEWVVMEAPSDSGPASLYEACRNTLVMVVGLFAVYLVFEFQTLWFRVFPKGFHYSGYAHQGAAWLTVALGLATVLLSIIFQGHILRDPRVSRLRTLAWVWSVENFILAIAVFHRLWIYVGFNGMTRMRTVGWLGIGAVVVGFLLVVIKIHRGKDFRWLLRRELWTVSFAAYLYVVMPVDRWITRYNVQRVLAGDPAPSVQISEHPLSAEGLLELEPLRNCSDPIIRDGIIAMLADQHDAEIVEEGTIRERGWTARQFAHERLLQQLGTIKAGAQVRPEKRHPAREAFRSYAYQWY